MLISKICTYFNIVLKNFNMPIFIKHAYFGTKCLVFTNIVLVFITLVEKMIIVRCLLHVQRIEIISFIKD